MSCLTAYIGPQSTWCDTKEYPAHWKNMRWLASPDLSISEDVRLNAMNDTNKGFHFVEWSISTDDEVDVSVH